MTEETTNVDEIKERLAVDIPVEEETIGKDEAQKIDITAELQDLGRQVGETLKTAWNSEERQRFESQVREGLKSFADEIDRVIRDVRSSEVAGRVKTEATGVKEKVETSDLGRKMQQGMAQGLHWMSEELGKLANQFTAPEKSPEDVGTAPAEETTEDAA